MTIDWPSIVFDPKMMGHIERACAKRFSSPGLAEEASTYIIEHLSSDDWSRCRQYSGTAKPETYLRVVISRALEDFSHKKFGKPRPPVWLKNQGQVWVSVWKMVCLERQLPESVKQALSGLNHTLGEIADMIRTIKGRMPWCGEVTIETPANPADGEEFSVNQYGATCTLEEMDEEQQQRDWLLFLSSLLNDSQTRNTSDDLDDRPELRCFQQQLQQLHQHLQLSDEERLLLILVYQENMKYSEAAKALGVPGHQPSRLLKRIHDRIADAFEAIGVSVDQLKALFEER